MLTFLVFCVAFAFVLCPMLLVSLNFPICIAPSAFYNVYIIMLQNIFSYISKRGYILNVCVSIVMHIVCLCAMGSVW